METTVLIKRTFSDDQKPFVDPLLVQLSRLAIKHKGFVCGETLKSRENPEEHLIISKWASIEEWFDFDRDEKVKQLYESIDMITGRKSSFWIYQHEWKNAS